MFSINNTEGLKGGGGGGGWKNSLLRSGQALDEGPLLKKEYLDPNFFAQLNQKILPCFNFAFTKFHLKRRDIVYCFQSQYGSK